MSDEVEVEAVVEVVTVVEAVGGIVVVVVVVARGFRGAGMEKAGTGGIEKTGSIAVEDDL